MGHVFLSPRLGVKAAAEGWQRAVTSVRPAEGAAAARLAGFARQHTSEVF